MITQKNLSPIWRFSKKFNIRFNHKILTTQDGFMNLDIFNNHHLTTFHQLTILIKWRDVLGKINKIFSPESTHLESIQFIHYLPHKYPHILFCCCCQRFMNNAPCFVTFYKNGLPIKHSTYSSKRCFIF